MIQKLGGTRGTVEHGRAWVRATLAAIADGPRVPVSAGRPDRRDQVRRLRRHQRPDRQPGDRPRLRPHGRRRRRGDVRGAGRAVRLRAAHGGPRHHAGRRRGDPRRHGQEPALLRQHGPWQLRRRQHLGRPQHGRGEVDRRLHQERHAADRGTAQARRAAHGARPLPHGHDPRRTGPLGLSQHQRHDRGGRDDRLRRPRRPVLDRLRLGRGLGDRTRGQGLLEPRDLSSDGGRHGRGRRPHPRGLRHAGRGRARRSWPRSRASRTAEPTKSEALGHQEFVLGYKHFEPLGPACFPG